MSFVFIFLAISACGLRNIPPPVVSPALEGETTRPLASPTVEPAPETDEPFEPPPELATPTMVLVPTTTQTPALTVTELPAQMPDPEPIVFGPEEVSSVMTGRVDKIKVYSIYALEGQIMQVVVRSATGEPALEVFSPAGEGLAIADSTRPFWRAVLPETGEYRLVVLSEREAVDFELSVLVVPPGETRWWTAYRDEGHGFELVYPDTFGVGYSDPTDGPAELSVVLSLVFLENAAFEGTNLRGADLSVYVGSSPAAVEGCLEMAPYEEGLEATELDGVPFVGGWFGDAGAGNIYEARAYRAVHADTCYEIVQILQSLNIDMLGSDTIVVEFDCARVLESIEEVMATFEFIR